MAESGKSLPLRIVAGEIESGLVTTRVVVPTTTLPHWPPFLRVTEQIASRGRHLPMHAHDREEVLTYVIEGYAWYQLEDKPTEQLAQGSARLLTAASRVRHSVGPGEGSSIRWFSLVVGLPRSFDGPERLQASGSNSPVSQIDNVEVRPLTGPGSPALAASGLQCEVMSFSSDSTTFRRVGADRRAMVYASAGQGSVDGRAMEAGETAFAEGVGGISVRGLAGFHAVFATAPRERVSLAGEASSSGA